MWLTAGGPAWRRRIRSAPFAWDWSIPTPFSQGWLVGDKVYVGGQISADRKGKAVNPDELVPQVQNTLGIFLRRCLSLPISATAAAEKANCAELRHGSTEGDRSSR